MIFRKSVKNKYVNLSKFVSRIGQTFSRMKKKISETTLFIFSSAFQTGLSNCFAYSVGGYYFNEEYYDFIRSGKSAL